MKLQCALDKRAETAEYDENVIGVYLWDKEGPDEEFAGHLPMELSKLMRQFLDANKKSVLIAMVTGTRKRLGLRDVFEQLPYYVQFSKIYEIYTSRK